MLERKRPFLRQKTCKFCADKVQDIDYKDTQTLRSYMTERGKIIPRRISGNCALHQRRLAKAIKMSRNIVLSPFAEVR